MNYYLGIDIAKTNHVASLINNNGDIVIRAIKFTNSKEGFNKLLTIIYYILKEDRDYIRYDHIRDNQN